MNTYLVVPTNSNEYTEFKAFSTKEAAIQYCHQQIYKVSGVIITETDTFVAYVEKEHEYEYKMKDIKRVWINKIKVNKYKVV